MRWPPGRLNPNPKNGIKYFQREYLGLVFWKPAMTVEPEEKETFRKGKRNPEE
jgi:hypothetical protein